MTIEKSGDEFRLLYDVKGRFYLQRLEEGAEERNFKLCRVNKNSTTANKVPYIVTHDGRTIRYPDPLIKVSKACVDRWIDRLALPHPRNPHQPQSKINQVDDTVKVDIHTGKVVDHVKFDLGNLAFLTRGHNAGRVGVIQHIERHPGSFDIITVKDAQGHTFATRRQNVFLIGNGNKPMVSLPKGKGIKLSIIEERNARKH